MVMMATVVMMTIDHVEGFVDNLNLNHISELFLQSHLVFQLCKYCLGTLHIFARIDCLQYLTNKFANGKNNTWCVL